MSHVSEVCSCAFYGCVSGFINFDLHGCVCWLLIRRNITMVTITVKYVRHVSPMVGMFTISRWCNTVIKCTIQIGVCLWTILNGTAIAGCGKFPSV